MTALAMLVDDGLWRTLSPWAWGVCILCLLPVGWRLCRLRGRYLDALLAITLLLAINRESFLFHVSAVLSHASATVLALTMAGFSVWYQRHDT